MNQSKEFDLLSSIVSCMRIGQLEDRNIDLFFFTHPNYFLYWDNDIKEFEDFKDIFVCFEVNYN